MPVKTPRLSLRTLYDMQEGRAAGVGQDIDSIKHTLRALRWRVDAIVNNFKIPVQPDSLEDILNPSRETLHKVIREARFASAEPKPKRKATKKRAKRRPKKKA